MTRRAAGALVPIVLVTVSLGAAATAAPPPAQDLLAAVRKGDLAAVRAALDQGVPVDARFRYDRTALSFAADRGHADIVTLLLDKGADVNAKDTFYGLTPIVWAAANEHVDVVKVLLARGATGADDVLGSGVEKRNAALVEAALATGKLDADTLAYAVEQAEKAGAADVAGQLRKAGAVPPPPADFKVEAATLARYAGQYKEETGAAQTIALSVADGGLQGTLAGGAPRKLGAFDAASFRVLDARGLVRLTVKTEGDRILGVTLKDSEGERWFPRVEDPRP
jgi:hypothetical protein